MSNILNYILIGSTVFFLISPFIMFIFDFLNNREMRKLFSVKKGEKKEIQFGFHEVKSADTGKKKVVCDECGAEAKSAEEAGAHATKVHFEPEMERLISAGKVIDKSFRRSVLFYTYSDGVFLMMACLGWASFAFGDLLGINKDISRLSTALALGIGLGLGTGKFVTQIQKYREVKKK